MTTLTTVTLFPHFDDLVATEGASARRETVALAAVPHRVQHRADVANRTGREAAVVGPVA